MQLHVVALSLAKKAQSRLRLLLLPLSRIPLRSNGNEKNPLARTESAGCRVTIITLRCNTQMRDPIVQHVTHSRKNGDTNSNPSTKTNRVHKTKPKRRTSSRSIEKNAKSIKERIWTFGHMKKTQHLI